MDRVLEASFSTALPQRDRSKQRKRRRGTGDDDGDDRSPHGHDAALLGEAPDNDFPMGRNEALRVTRDPEGGEVRYIVVSARTGEFLRECTLEQALDVISRYRGIAGLTVDRQM